MTNPIESMYDQIFDSINELVHANEDPERIFECIVDHFAFMAEDAAMRHEKYYALLNLFRSNDPILSVPEAEDEKESEAIDWNVDGVSLDPTESVDFFGSMNDINKSLMSEDADRFLDFVKNMKFSDKLDS